MKSILYILGLCSFLLFIACQNGTENPEQAVYSPHGNPAAAGFDAEGSDAEAIVIADEVMTAMGGYANWMNTRYLYWNFFGARTLLWDKETGDVRIEFPSQNLKALININTDEGQVMQGDQIVEKTDTLYPQLMRQAKSIWINDSYWLVMPFKLKDSGVTLGYEKEDTTATGAKSDVLSLTFKEVGFTPQNKYLVYVDKESKLVTQWDFYPNATDSIARFSTPWGNYKEYGSILLSDDRGERDLSDVKVLETVPEGAFTSFDEVEF